MSQSQYRARQVSAKTHEVIDYDHDESKPGKPLHILIPGGLIALAALAVIVFVAYLTWIDGSVNQTLGVVLILILSPFYVGGVFLFSYGYELYNIPRAIRLTAIIVFLTFAIVVIAAVLVVALGAGGKLPTGSSKEKSSGGGKPKSSPISSSSRNYSGGPNLGPVVFMPGLGGTRTREVTREVITEKKVEVPVAPRAIDCPYCRRSYVPAEQNYACPACGAATPPELIEESQEPREK